MDQRAPSLASDGESLVISAEDGTFGVVRDAGDGLLSIVEPGSASTSVISTAAFTGDDLERFEKTRRQPGSQLPGLTRVLVTGGTWNVSHRPICPDTGKDVAAVSVATAPEETPWIGLSIDCTDSPFDARCADGVLLARSGDLEGPCDPDDRPSLLSPDQESLVWLEGAPLPSADGRASPLLFGLYRRLGRTPRLVARLFDPPLLFRPLEQAAAEAAVERVDAEYFRWAVSTRDDTAVLAFFAPTSGLVAWQLEVPTGQPDRWSETSHVLVSQADIATALPDGAPLSLRGSAAFAGRSLDRSEFAFCFRGLGLVDGSGRWPVLRDGRTADCGAIASNLSKGGYAVMADPITLQFWPAPLGSAPPAAEYRLPCCGAPICTATCTPEQVRYRNVNDLQLVSLGASTSRPGAIAEFILLVGDAPTLEQSQADEVESTLYHVVIRDDGDATVSTLFQVSPGEHLPRRIFLTLEDRTFDPDGSGTIGGQAYLTYHSSTELHRVRLGTRPGEAEALPPLKLAPGTDLALAFRSSSGELLVRAGQFEGSDRAQQGFRGSAWFRFADDPADRRAFPRPSVSVGSISVAVLPDGSPAVVAAPRLDPITGLADAESLDALVMAWPSASVTRPPRVSRLAEGADINGVTMTSLDGEAGTAGLLFTRTRDDQALSLTVADLQKGQAAIPVIVPIAPASAPGPIPAIDSAASLISLGVGRLGASFCRSTVDGLERIFVPISSDGQPMGPPLSLGQQSRFDVAPDGSTSSLRCTPASVAWHGKRLLSARIGALDEIRCQLRDALGRAVGE